jgi:hypothetical protein
MSETTILNGVRLLMGAVAAVCAFLLVQTDVALDPWVNLVCGAIIVALAVINPSSIANGARR